MDPRLVVAARNAEKLQALADELGAHPFPVDATRSAQVDACVARVVERHGRLDAVAHCVGSLLLKPAHLTSDAEWDAALAVNLTSAFAVVRASARAMQDSGGSIVLVSSAAARAGLASHEAIAAAKAGIIGLVLSAAATYVGSSLDSSIPTGDVRLDAYTRIDVNASWQASPRLEAYVAVVNLTDVQYEEFVGNEARGILPRAGVRFNF